MSLSFLKKIGKDVAQGALFAGKGLAIAEGYGPILQAFMPPSVAAKVQKVEDKAALDLHTVDHIVKTVQSVGELGNLSGQQKLDAASGLVTTAFSDIMDLGGHEVQDPELLEKSREEFTEAMKMLTQARVDFLNSLKPK